MKTLLSVAAVAAISLSSTLVSAQNLAVVNGKPVPSSRVDTLASQIAKSGRPVNDEMRAQIKEEVITREIFMQEAQKRGLASTADYKAQMELARQTILIRELFTVGQKDNAVTDAEVKAEYDKAVEAAKTVDADKVMATWKGMKMNDFFGSGQLRADGRYVHDMYLMEVKKPSESTKPWDYYKLIKKLPGESVFTTKAESKCALWK